MSEEEKKKIQIINNFIMYCRGFEENKYTDKELFTVLEDISILLQNKQIEIEKEKEDIQRMQELLDLSDANNVKKDKVINEMAYEIADMRDEGFMALEIDEIINEFERKVEG